MSISKGINSLFNLVASYVIFKMIMNTIESRENSLGYTGTHLTPQPTP